MNMLFLSDLDAAGEWIATQSHIENLKKANPTVKIYLIAVSKNIRPYFLKRSLFTKIHIIKARKFAKPFKSYRETVWQIVKFAISIRNLLSMNVRIHHVIATYYLGALGSVFSLVCPGYYFYFHGIRCNYRIFPHNVNHFMIFNKILEKAAWAMSKRILSPARSPRLFPASKIIYLPNIVRQEFIADNKYPYYKKGGYIVYSGRLAHGKGVSRLIAAFKSIKFDVKLAICYVETGSKAEKEILLRWRNTPSVVFYRNLSPQRLVSVYKKSRLAILPSEFEIAPLFYLEAISMGLPIITKAQGEINSWAEELGVSNDKLFLKDLSEDEIAEKIALFLREEAWFRRIFQRSRVKFIDKYHKNGSKLNLLKVIDDYEK